MKAIQVVKPGQLEIIEKEMPQIQHENEVLIQVKMAGICGSDVHIYHGTSPVATYPRVIGHEVTGQVVKTGEDVTSLKVDDHVVIEPILTCGECYACRSGRQNVCQNLKVFGVHMDGGYQEYVVVPEKMAHKVDPTLDWKESVLVEPFTIGAQANWRGDVRQGDVVFIMGAGPIGICALQVAKYRGATCIISDLSEEKLSYAQSLGADFTINPLKEDIFQKVNELTEGMGANVVIDAVCTTKTFEQAVQLASVAGRIVVLGFSEEKSGIPQLEITKKELTVSGSRLQTNQFPEVIDLFNNRKIDTNSFVTHTFPFEQVEEAIQLIETNPDAVRKVHLDFSR
jgi:2-desacetyl-2-hydroxyethyl bacteriochlorophyllide A dehydrogenase